MGFRVYRVQGLGFIEFRVQGFQGLEFRVQGLGFKVISELPSRPALLQNSPERGSNTPGLGFRVQGSDDPANATVAVGLGFRVQGLGFRVQCQGFRVRGLGFKLREGNFGHVLVKQLEQFTALFLRASRRTIIPNSIPVTKAPLYIWGQRFSITFWGNIP